MKRFRAAAIGSGQRGKFGHGLDTCFLGVEGVDLVALADDDPEGLAAAAKRTGVRNLYRDYREMLAKEKPDVVSVGPRWLDQRVEMVTAAARAGCHLYCEKPLAASLADADTLLAACDRAGVRIAVAHQLRAMPPVRRAFDDVRAGKYGKLVALWARPKDDRRGGGEELLIHGTHLFDLMVALAGPPRWVSGHVTVAGRDATRADRRPASEPVGPVAGDSISALYGFDHGVRGHFDSTADLDRPGRTPYGLLVQCEEASVLMRAGDVYVYGAGAVVPENDKLQWDKVWIEDWHFFPDHKPRPTGDRLDRGNRLLVRDLLDAAVQGRALLTSGADARWALEMIFGVYASHLADGRRLPLPLKVRQHPLGE